MKKLTNQINEYYRQLTVGTAACAVFLALCGATMRLMALYTGIAAAIYAGSIVCTGILLQARKARRYDTARAMAAAIRAGSAAPGPWSQVRVLLRQEPETKRLTIVSAGNITELERTGAGPWEISRAGAFSGFFADPARLYQRDTDSALTPAGRRFLRYIDRLGAGPGTAQLRTDTGAMAAIRAWQEGETE